MEAKETYQKIFEKYGFEAQREKWIEELLELIVAIQQSKFKNVDNNIKEEIADVEICLEQMRLHFDNTVIDIWKKNKLKSLPEKLKL